ncbi:UNVERIFIED_CONTAM: hypothetical protein FKN15_053554 [Acipenser sinensis]
MEDVFSSSDDSSGGMGSLLLSGPDNADCSLRLSGLQKLKVMEDVFSSSDDSSGGMGSLLLSGPDNADCSLRLSGLQKLKVIAKEIAT